ncbi:MAG: DUF7210 family protein [Halomonas sp.]
MSDKPKTVPVKLSRAHTHQRKPHKAEETIYVRPHVADYLEKNGIGKRTTA